MENIIMVVGILNVRVSIGILMIGVLVFVVFFKMFFKMMFRIVRVIVFGLFGI